MGWRRRLRSEACSLPHHEMLEEGYIPPVFSRVLSRVLSHWAIYLYVHFSPGIFLCSFTQQLARVLAFLTIGTWVGVQVDDSHHTVPTGKKR